jgi:hypothetical protein
VEQPIIMEKQRTALFLAIEELNKRQSDAKTEDSRKAYQDAIDLISSLRTTELNQIKEAFNCGEENSSIYGLINYVDCDSYVVKNYY